MLEGRVIRGVNLGSDSFRNAFKDLPANVQREAADVIKAMIFANLDQAPAAWHLHLLTNKQVPSKLDPTKKVKVWTIHITADDRYKASFTLEDGVAFFRTCGKHDAVDKRP